MHAYRSHTCAELSARRRRRRPCGCRAGCTGCATTAACCSSTCATTTASPRCWPTATARPSPTVEKVRAEWVIRVDGVVKARDAGPRQPEDPDRRDRGLRPRRRGAVGAAEELPLPVFGEADYPEETRLKYRFLDLRREQLHRNDHAARRR